MAGFRKVGNETFKSFVVAFKHYVMNVSGRSQFALLASLLLSSCPDGRLVADLAVRGDVGEGSGVVGGEDGTSGSDMYYHDVRIGWDPRIVAEQAGDGLVVVVNEVWRFRTASVG